MLELLFVIGFFVMLAAFIFQFVVAHSFSPPALREARRLPDVSSLSHYFI